MLESELRRFGPVPFSHGSLLPLLSDYRRPNDKIADWLRRGVLVAARRGLYVTGPLWRNGELSLPLVANRLYGPSCVSLDYALAWHGLIPERVHEITSVCMRRGRVLENALGRFSYVKLPANLFPIGIMQVEASEQTTFLLASPSKALCDKVLLTPHLQAGSVAAMRVFLFDDLRVDGDALAGIDLTVAEEYTASGQKPRQMRALLKVLEEYQ
jgi:hypothetical protein